jgi:hypothetical protein
LKNWLELQGDFRRQRMSFIHVELDAGITFAQVANTERATGNEERAQHNIGLARQAYDEAQIRMEQCDPVDSPDAFDAAQDKSSDLLALIEAFAAG